MIQNLERSNLCRSIEQVPDYDLEDMLVVTAPGAAAGARRSAARHAARAAPRARRHGHRDGAGGRPPQEHGGLPREPAGRRRPAPGGAHPAGAGDRGALLRPGRPHALHRRAEPPRGQAGRGRPSTGSPRPPPSPPRRTRPTSCAAPLVHARIPIEEVRALLGARSRMSPAGSPRSPAPATRSTASRRPLPHRRPHASPTSSRTPTTDPRRLPRLALPQAGATAAGECRAPSTRRSRVSGCPMMSP